MMVKDSTELEYIRKAGELSSQLMKYYQRRMEEVIENDKKITHKELSQELLSVLDDPLKKLKLELQKEDIDACYEPLIQSGENYVLKPNIENTNDTLNFEKGTIVVMLGYSFKEYGSNMARSFIIDASNEQKETYNLLLQIFKKGLLELRTNAKLSEVYDACIKTIRKSKKPELEHKFTKNCGYGIGLGFRENDYVINKKNDRIFKKRNGFQFSSWI